MWLTETEENVTFHDDGTVTVRDCNSIPMSTWQKINDYLRRRGFDLRGAEDTKRLLSRHKVFSDQHADAFRQVMGPRTPRPERTPAQKIITKCKRVFGTTTNFAVAGYILPDGTMLDFSGARLGSGNVISTQREVDHRQIGYATGKGGIEGVHEFCIGTGSIRVSFSRTGAAFIDCYQEPNAKQYQTLARGVVTMASGGIYLELRRGNDKDRFAESYPAKTNVLKVIQQFYRGESPTGPSLVQQFH